MFGSWLRPSRSGKRYHRSRRLAGERLERRQMLTAMSDIVFLVDASGSEQTFQTLEWLGSIVQQLDGTLRSANGIDVRYGLIGFGQDARFAHSQVVGSNPGSVFDRLFSDGDTGADHVADIEAAIDELRLQVGGGSEDGWDAIDHAIAEYDFRLGAVPAFVLVQNDEGRIAGPGVEGVNNTLTHDGILAALKSKNVILNTMVVGAGGSPGSQALFDLFPHGLDADIRLLGVEADGADGRADGVHDYHWVDTNTFNSTSDVPTTTTADTLQISFNGSGTGATGMVGSRKSIVIERNADGATVETDFGYSARSVPFEFVDMSSGTTTISPGSAASIPGTGFSFHGSNYTQVYVNPEGMLTFDAAHPTGVNIDLSRAFYDPTAPAVPMIAVLWDELRIAA